MNAIMTTIQGNATADATIFKFDGGGCRTSVTVAVNDRYYDVQAKEWKERKPEYVRVQVRRESLANNVVLSVKRGQPLLCTGRLVTQTWEDRDGNTRTELLMHADHVAIDLTYGTAQYAKSAPSWVDENTGEVRTTSPDVEEEAAEGESSDAAHAQLESHTGTRRGRRLPHVRNAGVRGPTLVCFTRLLGWRSGARTR